MHKAACFVTRDRMLDCIAFEQNSLSSFSSTVPVRVVAEGTGTLTLLLQNPGMEKPQVMFSSARSPKRIRFSGQVIHAERSGSEYLLSLPDYNKGPAPLEIAW